MENFIFQSPTKIYFGPNEENRVGEYITNYGFKSVLLVYGKNSAKRSGLYDRVILSLKKANINYQELSGIEANPSLDGVIKGLDILKKNPCELILALGGGSVIDTAKAIAHGYYYQGNPFDFNEHLITPEKALPVGVILTIAASGSELSTSCVIQDTTRKLKRGFNSETNRPLFAIENPDLLIGVPDKQIAYGIVDILSHSMERYFSPSEDEFADYMALGLMKSVVDAANLYLEKGNIYQVRKTLMLASSFSHNGMTSIMKKISMPVHQLEHELSGLHQDIAHGAGLAVLYSSWMKEVIDSDLIKFAKFGEVVFSIKEEDMESRAYLAIVAYEELMRKLQLSLSLKELGVREEELEIMAKAFTNRHIKGIKDLDISLARKIYRRAWN